jgi:hypothetical protein
MSKYRRHLPQLKDRLFVTDGGLETTLVFHEGSDLPGAPGGVTHLTSRAAREECPRPRPLESVTGISMTRFRGE